MSKETRNIVIAAVVALIIGYVAGSAMQTGRCPLTGMVICKDRAAACEKAKACATSCEEKEGEKTPATEEAKSEEAKPADAAH